MNLYNSVELEEDVMLIFVGVHALRWNPAWGEPTIGFREADTEQMLDRLMAGIEGLAGATAGIEDECREMLRKCIGGDNATD